MAITTDTYKLTPDQARDLGGEFARQADVTQSLISDMNKDIGYIQQMISLLSGKVAGMDWSGWSALKFDNDWNSTFRPEMQRMQQHMEEFVPVLTKLREGLRETQAYLSRRADATERIDREGAL